MPAIPESDLDFRLNDYQFVKDHNSYELISRPQDIVDRIAVTPVIELDLWSVGSGDWAVSHDPIDPLEYTAFSRYLSYIQLWHEQNPGHDILLINVDFKTDWTLGSGRGDFDKLIRTYFSNEELYRPIDLRGGHANCRRGARHDGWPTLRALQGKVMFFITGGPAFRHNQHQSAYIKSQIIDNDYQGVAFVAPDVDDQDDTWDSRTGDLDGINEEKDHVVMFNARWQDRYNVDSGNVAGQNLLLAFWDVPVDRGSFAVAVQQKKASIIGSKQKPEDIESESKMGRRGRKIEAVYVTIFEDDNGWEGHGDSHVLKEGRYDNKGKGPNTKLPKGWNDEIRAVEVPEGTTVYMTDQDSFQKGGKGAVSIDGPRTVNVKDVAANSGLAGKISSIKVYPTGHP